MNRENINTKENWNAEYSKGFYQDLHRQDLKFWSKLIDNLIRDNILVDGINILELGCGLAQNAEDIYSKIKCNYVATDFSSVAIVESKKRYNKGINFLICDFFKACKEIKSNDVIIAIEILEHFEDTELPLRAIYKALKDDGKLIFSVPMDTGINGVMKWHYSYWDYNSATLRLYDVGFKSVKYYKNTSLNSQIMGVAFK